MKKYFAPFILLLTMTSWSQEHKFRDPAIGSKYRKDSIEILKKRMLEMKEAKLNDPKIDQTFDIEGLGSYILKFELADKQGTVINNKRREEITIDFENDQCLKRQPNYCDALVRDLAEFKKEYNEIYRPKKINYPKLDLENLTYTMANGTGYNLNTGSPMRVSTVLVQTATPDPIKTVQPAMAPKKKLATSTSSSEKNY